MVVEENLLDTSNWHTLGKVRYEKWKVYGEMHRDLKDLDLADFHVAVAPFAGPIAALKDRSKLTPQTSAANGEENLLVFNSAGKLLAQVPWRNQNDQKNRKKLVKMCWTQELRLLCVFADGRCQLFSVHGEVENEFSFLTNDASGGSSDQVLSVANWGGGFVAITTRLLLIQVIGVDDTLPKISLMADIQKAGISPDNSPTCLAVIEPRFLGKEAQNAEALIGTSRNSLVIASKETATDMEVQQSLEAPITRMSVAPNGMFMAIYTQDGMLTVLSTKLDSKVLSFDTKSNSSPQEMCWCGEDSVMLSWKRKGLVMVGPFGSWLRFNYNTNFVLSQELDCCRVISNNCHEVIMRVPAPIEAIKKIGSTEPAAMLYVALESFDNGDAKADENIRNIQADNQLPLAISQCIDAAGCEFQVSNQRKLLRAAAYGNIFFNNSNSNNNSNSAVDLNEDTFVEMCRKIRVLNELRLRTDIGLPLTVTEFDRLGPEVVISRLVALHHHFLALKICEYLHINSDFVLVNWACEKVKKSTELSDEAVVSLVRKKLKQAKNVSYSEIASYAERADRRRLATMLLDLEEKPQDQVPLLLSMGEYELAIRKSIASADTDLIYMTLLLLERNMELEDFCKLLRCEARYKEAVDLMLKYYKQRNKKNSHKNKLLALWKEYDTGPSSDNASSNSESSNATAEVADYKTAQAYKYLSKCCTIRDADEKEDKVKDIISKLKEAASAYTTARDPIKNKFLEEHIVLLEEQLKLERKTGLNLIGLSVSETIYELCIGGVTDPRFIQLATALGKKCKVPEKRLFRVRINAFASSKQWEALHRLSQESKKNVPLHAFAAACLKNGDKNQAEAYAARITTNEEKFEAFVTLEMWEKALEVAIKMKDPEKLSTVRNHCQDIHIIEQVNLAAQQLGFTE